MWIHLKKPYKIIAIMAKRYHDHYHIPASQCLVIPLKRLDEDVSCCVHWQDDGGIHTLFNMMFASENLEPVNDVGHEELFELWESLKPINS